MAEQVKKKTGKTVGLIVLLLVLLSAAAVIIWQSKKPQVLDGPGMVYTWTDYELYGSRWVETDAVSGQEPAELSFSKDEVTIKGNGRETAYSYALPEGTDITGKPEGEVYLTLSDCPEFEDLIFHEEKIGEDEWIPVLSGTIFEYDGRGEIVIAEFVREEDMAKLPADFRSQTCIERNDREPVPMIKPE